MSLEPWWKQYPERLAYELAALEEAGIRYERDEAAFPQGTLRLRLDTGGLLLYATFPDLYPYTRFEAEAPELSLPHHQHPFSKTLCLIGRGSANWSVDDTLAAFLRERLPLVLEAGTSSSKEEGASELEEHQAEPFSDYYNYLPDSVVLVDGSWSFPGESGRLELGLMGSGPIVRGAVLRALDMQGHEFAMAPENWKKLTSNAIRARWFRVGDPIEKEDAEAFLNELGKIHPQAKAPHWQKCGQGWKVDVVGVIFPEEVGWREVGDGWLFVIRARKEKSKSPKNEHGFVPAMRSGPGDLFQRVPELRPLRSKNVAVLGLGCLGAPSLIEFAKAGVGKLQMVDHDSVDPATTVRWPLGLPIAGLTKQKALTDFISLHYPHTEVVGYKHKIGGLPNSESRDNEVLEEIFDGCQVVYDATAELGIQYAISELARRSAVPYIAVSTTAGGWGGLVARITPKTGCWSCLQAWMTEGVIPTPPSDPRGAIQPAGCADPTFTGAGFDTALVAFEGVRMAVAELCSESGGYPHLTYDVAILSLRDAKGNSSPPTWRSFGLKQHPDCPVCHQ